VEGAAGAWDSRRHAVGKTPWPWIGVLICLPNMIGSGQEHSIPQFTFYKELSECCRSVGCRARRRGTRDQFGGDSSGGA
jgi:hypothetical protein